MKVGSAHSEQGVSYEPEQPSGAFEPFVPVAGDAQPGCGLSDIPALRALGVRGAVDTRYASKHTVPHGKIIELLVVNRWQAPKPLYRAQDWLAQSGLKSTLGVQAEQARDTRLGESLDAVYEQHQAIWQEVVLEAVRRYHF